MSSELAIADAPLTIRALQNMLSGAALPDRYENIGDAVATIKVGAEIGLPPMAALMELYVVNGSVGMSGKAMQALVLRAGHRIDMRLDGEVGTARAWRRDPYSHELVDVGEYTFTLEDAERAKMLGKDTYKKYPADMLGWKAVARAVRFAFPDVIMGYLPSEIGFNEEEFDPIDGAFDGGGDGVPDDPMLEQHLVNTDDIIEAEEVADILDGKVVEE